MKLGLILALVITLAACAPQGPSSQQPHDTRPMKASPQDVGTAEEYEVLHSVINEIQALSQQLGYSMDFKSIPVSIYPHAFDPDSSGLCLGFKSPDPKTRRIGVSKNMFDTHRAHPQLSMGSLKSSLFKILLHEYGHCLFDRSHQNDLLVEPGQNYILQEDFDQNKYYYAQKLFPVTMMHEEAPITMILPKSLKKYYLRELFDEVQIQNFQRIVEFDEVLLVDDNEIYLMQLDQLLQHQNFSLAFNVQDHATTLRKSCLSTLCDEFNESIQVKDISNDTVKIEYQAGTGSPRINSISKTDWESNSHNQARRLIQYIESSGQKVTITSFTTENLVKSNGNSTLHGHLAFDVTDANGRLLSKNTLTIYPEYPGVFQVGLRVQNNHWPVRSTESTEVRAVSRELKLTITKETRAF